MRKYLNHISALCFAFVALANVAAPSKASAWNGNGSFGYYPNNNCCPTNPCCYPQPCCPPPCNPCCPPPCNPCCPPQCCPPPCCPPPCCPQPCCPQPCCNNSCFTLRGEGLYTRACNSGLAFATTKNRNTARGTNFHSEFEHPSSDWRWGYRGSASLSFCGCWDFTGSYTHFCDKADGNEQNTRTEVVSPVYGFFIQEFANVHADYDLKIDYIDLTFSRKFGISDCVCIKPFFGGKLARIRQHYNIHNRLLTFPSDLITALSESIHLDNKYEGGGIMAGMESVWGLGCGLSLVSTADGAILFGKKKFDFSDRIATRTGTTTTVQNRQFEDDTCSCRYIVDLAASLRWEGSCGCNVLGLEVGYEGHLFINANNFVNELDASNVPTLAQGSRSDLCVHGGRAAAFIRF